MTIGLLTLLGVWLGATFTRRDPTAVPPPYLIANTTPPTVAEIRA